MFICSVMFDFHLLHSVKAVFSKKIFYYVFLKYQKFTLCVDASARASRTKPAEKEKILSLQLLNSDNFY